MSTCTHESMTNHHVPGILSQLSDTLHLWRQRYQARQELAHWTERDLHDIGLSSSDVAYEAEKPFWRA
jgi:uncharacterized protein YjiS (DUF1127 family)